jgi:integrase/recombinase XerD
MASAKRMQRRYSGKVLLISDWPVIDHSIWLARGQGSDLLSAKRPCSDWSAASWRLVEGAYGRWLSFLARRQELNPSTSPGDRVTPSLIQSYVLDARTTNRPTSVEMHVSGLLRALSVLEPERDWSWLRGIAANLSRIAQSNGPMARKVIPIVELFQLGIEMMTDAVAVPDQSTIVGARFRDGLMISLLAARPVRLRNLTAIRINRELQARDNGYRLEFRSDETKGHRRIDLSLHPALTEYMELYLRQYRPLLCGGARLRINATDALWISDRGTVLSAAVITQNIAKRTLEGLGVIVRPHHFRRCFATSMAIEDPMHVRAASTILSHANIATTEKHYNRAKTLEAGRTFAKSIHYLGRSLRTK